MTKKLKMNGCWFQNSHIDQSIWLVVGICGLQVEEIVRVVNAACCTSKQVKIEWLTFLCCVHDHVWLMPF